MTTTLWWLAENFVAVSALVVVVSVACRFLRNRPAVQHALWLLVLVKFVTPPIVTWPWSAGDVRDCVARVVAPADRGTEAAPSPPTVPTAPIPLTTLPIEDSGPLAPVEPSDDTDIDFAPFVLGDYDSADVGSLSDWTDAAAALPGNEPLPLEFDAGQEPLPSDSIAAAEPAHDSNIAAAEPTRERSLSPMLTEALRLAPPMVFVLWLAGCFLFAVVQLRRIARHGRVVSRARPAPSALVEEITGVARNLNMRPLPAVVAREIAAPFVWCLGWLRMIWPESLTGGEKLARSRGIIAHELAHVRRRDHWVAWMELAVGVVWWWNPLFWFVRRRLRESAEMACDAIALAAYDDRRAYAEMFLELSLRGKTGAPAPVLGVGSGTPSRFERRLSMILSDRVTGKASLGGLLLVGLLAAVALPGWSLAQLASDRQPGTEQPTTKSGETRNGETPLGVNSLAQNAAAGPESGSFVPNSADGVESGDFVVVPAGDDNGVSYRLADLPSQIRKAQAVYREDARKLAEIKRQVAERPDGTPELVPLDLQLKVLQDQIDVERLINHYNRLNMVHFQSQNRTRTSGNAHSKRPAEDRIRSMGIEDLDASDDGRAVPLSERGKWDVEVYPGTSSDRYIRRLDGDAIEVQPKEDPMVAAFSVPKGSAQTLAIVIRKLYPSATIAEHSPHNLFVVATRSEMREIENWVKELSQVEEPDFEASDYRANAWRYRGDLTDSAKTAVAENAGAAASQEVKSKAEFEAQARLLKLDVEAARARLRAIDVKLQSLAEAEQRRKENNDTSHNFTGMIRDQTLERDLAAIAVERAEVALELFHARHPQFSGKTDPESQVNPVKR